MEKQQTKLDKAVKVSIIVGILIVALSIAYYLVIFSPNKERENRKKLVDCLNKATEEYFNFAERNGKKMEDGSVSANGDVWDRASKDKKERQDNCFKLYSQD